MVLWAAECRQLRSFEVNPGGDLSLTSDDQLPLSCALLMVASTLLELRRETIRHGGHIFHDMRELDGRVLYLCNVYEKRRMMYQLIIKVDLILVVLTSCREGPALLQSAGPDCRQCTNRSECIGVHPPHLEAKPQSPHPHRVFSKESMMNDFIRRACSPAQAQVPHSAGGCPLSERNGVGYCGFFFSEHMYGVDGPWKQTAKNNQKSTGA